MNKADAEKMRNSITYLIRSFCRHFRKDGMYFLWAYDDLTQDESKELDRIIGEMEQKYEYKGEYDEQS